MSGWTRSGILFLAMTAGVALAHGESGTKRFSVDTARMPGFTVLSAEDGIVQAPDLAVIEYKGPVAFPMAANLRAIWHAIRDEPRFRRVLLRLDSAGGSDIEGRAAIDVLAEIRNERALRTVVAEGGVCASMCVALYIQGDKRYASPASAWMFHGAARHPGGVPSLPLTGAYFDLFRQRKIDQGFIDFLYAENYVTTTGTYWIAGSELARRSNIVTDLLPNWQPAEPVERPAVIRAGI